MALEPVDMDRCQCEITTQLSPFTMGGDLRPRTERCRNTPVTVVTETLPGLDGWCGAMSLCQHCLLLFLAEKNAAGHKFEPIEQLGSK